VIFITEKTANLGVNGSPGHISSWTDCFTNVPY